MFRFLCGLGLAMTLLLAGCGSSEEPQTGSSQADKSAEAQKPAVQVAKDVAAKVEQKVEEVAKQAQDIAEGKAAEVKQEATEVATAAQEAAKKAEQKVADAVANPLAAVKAAVTKAEPGSAADMLTLKASYGDINFPHAMHAEAYACTLCHGEGTPGAFDLTKDTAHPLCKDCHKQEGAGPTGCKDCHKK